MKKGMYSVLELKAAYFMAPFYMRTKPEAVRAFTSSIVEGETLLSKNPEDFVLYKIGSFNDVTAKIEENEPYQIITAIEVLAMFNSEEEKEDA